MQINITGKPELWKEDPKKKTAPWVPTWRLSSESLSTLIGKITELQHNNNIKWFWLYFIFVMFCCSPCISLYSCMCDEFFVALVRPLVSRVWGRCSLCLFWFVSPTLSGMGDKHALVVHAFMVIQTLSFGLWWAASEAGVDQSGSNYV